jgi:hypothetical protein
MVLMLMCMLCGRKFDKAVEETLDAVAMMFGVMVSSLVSSLAVVTRIVEAVGLLGVRP